MAVSRRPAPVNEVDLEQTAELPVIDFTGTHAEISASDATISVAALSMDDTLARTDTFSVPSLTGAAGLADNLRDVEERLHRKSERVASLERELDALRAHELETKAALEARLATTQSEAAAELVETKAQAQRNLASAQEAAADVARRLKEATARHDEAQRRVATLETRIGQHISTLSSNEKDLGQRARRIEELQGELAQASGLARELGQARDGLVERVRGLESSLTDRTGALDARVSELAAVQSRLAGSEAERVRVGTERDDLRGSVDRQLEALHRADGYRNVIDALVGERDNDVLERDAEIARLQIELKQLAERDERIASLESQLAETRERLSQQDLRVSALSTDGRALEGRLGELNEALSSADRSALAQSEALRVAAEHAVEVESQLTAERERSARLGEDLSTAARTASAELERLRVTAATDLERAHTSASAELEAARAAASAEREAARAAATAELETARREAAAERDRLHGELTAERATARSTQEALAVQATERDAELARLKDAQIRLETDVTAREQSIGERERAVTELLDDQQDQLTKQKGEMQAAIDASARLEGDLRAAEEQLRHYEAEQRHRDARVEELSRSAESLQTRLDEAQRRLNERDEQVKRLETEARASASVLGKLQQSIQRISREDTGSRPVVSEAPLEAMTRVLVRVDGGMEQVFSLAKRTTLGRTPDNDIRLDANFVSRHHAVVLSSAKQTLIEDLNSTNGVVVNGRRVTRQPLQDGDVVNIGTTEFRFQLRPKGHAGEPS